MNRFGNWTRWNWGGNTRGGGGVGKSMGNVCVDSCELVQGTPYWKRELQFRGPVAMR